jgi:hypothetical protein
MAAPMPRRSKPRSTTKPLASSSEPADPYREHWRELPPFERLERSWRLRRLLRDPQAVHDAKTLPEL